VPADLACTLTIAKDGTNSAPAPRGDSRAHNCPARPEMVRSRLVTIGASTITLRHSLHSALKEFFNPLRTGDPAADFFAAYRKEASDFDRDYGGKYDGDLNTTLIFVSRSIFVLVTENRTQRYPGWSVLRGQYNIRHCYPTKSRTGSERYNRFFTCKSSSTSLTTSSSPM